MGGEVVFAPALHNSCKDHDAILTYADANTASVDASDTEVPKVR